MKNRWTATIIVAIILIVGCTSNDTTSGSTEINKIVAQSQAEINCPFLNKNIVLQSTRIPEKDTLWTWHDYGNYKPEFSKYRFGISCSMGNEAGENKNYFYCKFDTGCVEVTEKDVIKGYLRTYAKAGYKVTDSMIDHVNEYGSDSTGRVNLTSYNISAEMMECVSNQKENNDIVDCHKYEPPF